MCTCEHLVSTDQILANGCTFANICLRVLSQRGEHYYSSGDQLSCTYEVPCALASKQEQHWLSCE